MSKTLAREGECPSIEELLELYLHEQGGAGWQTGRYKIDSLAQDQVLICFAQDQRILSYRGRPVSGEPQSESPKYPRHASVSYGRVATKLLYASTWGTDERREPLPARRASSSARATAAQIAPGVPEATATELANGILRPDEEVKWHQLRKLVLAAEDADFSVEQSQRLAPRLLALALKHRDSSDTQDAAPVLAAIRTGASMLRPEQASQLMPLLEPGHTIETTLVTVKMIGRIFEAQPPSGTDQFADLAREVREIADSFLTPYGLAMSQNAAMAQLAIFALASMGSSDVLGAVRKTRDLNQSWFVRRTRRKLSGLLGRWNALSSGVSAAPLELLKKAISEVQQ